MRGGTSEGGAIERDMIVFLTQAGERLANLVK